LIRIPILFTALFLLTAGYLYGASNDTLQVDGDQRAITWQPYDQNVISQFKSDESFNYYQEPSTSRSLTGMLSKWLSVLFGDSVSKSVLSVFSKVLYYIFIALLIGIFGYAVYMLAKAQKYNFWQRRDEGLAADISNEDIHAIDFEKEIEASKHQQMWSRAVRFIYLYALKLMTDKDLITWEEGKTNREYLEEISSQDVKALFARIGYYFEYLWYGHFDITREDYGNVEQVYHQLRSKLYQYREN